MTLSRIIMVVCEELKDNCICFNMQTCQGCNRCKAEANQKHSLNRSHTLISCMRSGRDLGEMWVRCA
jgi:hypothetical protein